jgi:hypothetical protein
MSFIPRKIVDRVRPASAGRFAFYLLRAVSVTEESASGISSPADETARVAAARSRAELRLQRQRGALRPLGWGVIAIVVAGSLTAHPAPGVHGKAIGVLVALCAFVLSLAGAIQDRFAELRELAQVPVLALIGAAGVALTALQPKGATGLAGGAGVWMAVARLPLAPGAALAGAVTAALDLAAALTGSSASGIAATTLCAPCSR